MISGRKQASSVSQAPAKPSAAAHQGACGFVGGRPRMQLLRPAVLARRPPPRHRKTRTPLDSTSLRIRVRLGVSQQRDQLSRSTGREPVCRTTALCPRARVVRVQVAPCMVLPLLHSLCSVKALGRRSARAARVSDAYCGSATITESSPRSVGGAPVSREPESLIARAREEPYSRPARSASTSGAQGTTQEEYAMSDPVPGMLHHADVPAGAEPTSRPTHSPAHACIPPRAPTGTLKCIRDSMDRFCVSFCARGVPAAA